MDWYSKKHATVETATFGWEFIAARPTINQIVNLRTTLCYLGIPIQETSYVFGDNKTIIDASSTSHAKLHKRHNALSFHCVQEAVASKYVMIFHLAAGQIQPCQHSQQALGLCFSMANHECPSICPRRYMGSFRWWMQGGIASLWIHVICLDNTSLPRGVTRFAWWRQDLHAIELLRAHIGEWTMTRMLDYWWVMCFTSYQLNWNPWIWIPFPVDLDCTLLCAQVDKTRYSSIASGNNCIVQLCKCVWLHL
jgi:hypothetical protein